MSLPLHLCLLRLNDISSGLRAPPTLRPLLPLFMSGSPVRSLLTWRSLTSVVTPSHGPVFVGVPGQHQHQFGIHSGDFIQFVFPATDDYPADQVGDPSAAQVTQLVGIVLPFLLHNSVQIPGGKGVAPVSQALYQLRLPVLDRLNTTVETCVLPPISLSLSFQAFFNISSASRSTASLKLWVGHTLMPL